MAKPVHDIFLIENAILTTWGDGNAAAASAQCRNIRSRTAVGIDRAAIMKRAGARASGPHHLLRRWPAGLVAVRNERPSVGAAR